MIDLHTHTTSSDGTLSSGELLHLAIRTGVQALAITDHDTFSGYDQAKAQNPDLELVCGIELSTKYQDKTVHLLGYFVHGEPTAAFREWIAYLQANRHERNKKLVAKLQSAGMNITFEEVSQRGGSLPGRPHFAALLVEKGIAASIQEAFDLYLDEQGSCYVPREEPSFQEAVKQMAAGGGISSLAHPVRISRNLQVVQEHVAEMQALGLRAIEVYHSDHSAEEMSFYLSLAGRYALGITGGSDFHGDNKPTIALGTGKNRNLNIERSVLENLQRLPLA
ncbi:MAG TPA: PHP domain-containing protein [Candidatus Angelobacter sp.]|nr:PHP domain-containing protein [Candidatus Angelobacter sp.]